MQIVLGKNGQLLCGRMFGNYSPAFSGANPNAKGSKKKSVKEYMGRRQHYYPK